MTDNPVTWITWIKNHRDLLPDSCYPPNFRSLLDLQSRSRSLGDRFNNSPTFPKDGGRIISAPVIIVAGGADSIEDPQLSQYRTLLVEAFCIFSGTIISGGTTTGVCGLVGDLQQAYPETIRTIGYVPGVLPAAGEIDSRYREIRRTGGTRFGVLEPLQYWEDILASGIPSGHVKLIGIGGGEISAAEYRIALLLGAKVGVVGTSGGAAADLLEDAEWNDQDNISDLPCDRIAFRDFIGSENHE